MSNTDKLGLASTFLGVAIPSRQTCFEPQASLGLVLTTVKIIPKLLLV